MLRRIKCWLEGHRFEFHWNEIGQCHRRCTRCGKWYE